MCSLSYIFEFSCVIKCLLETFFCMIVNKILYLYLLSASWLSVTKVYFEVQEVVSWKEAWGQRQLLPLKNLKSSLL